MKTAILALSVLFGSSIYAQKAILKVEESATELPVNITATLEAQYQDYFVDFVSEYPATIIEREYQVTYKKPITGVFSKLYEVQLIGDNGMMKIFFDAEGNIVMIKETVRTNELPTAVMLYLVDNYGEWNVIGATEKLKMNEKGQKIAYRVLITNGKKKKELYFDAKGKYMDA